jgi:hypothetical protein
MGLVQIYVDSFNFYHFIGEHQNLDRDWGRTRSRSEQKPQLTLRGGIFLVLLNRITIIKIS